MGAFLKPLMVEFDSVML